MPETDSESPTAPSEDDDAEPTPSSDPRSVWWWFGVALLATVAAACLVSFVRGAWLLLGEPHVLNYTEGISLLAGQRLLAGQPLYPDVNQPPYVYLAYPPVYPALCAVTLGVFGKSLLALRGLTLLCELGVGALIYGILRQDRLSRGRALLFAALALGLFSVNKFHILARVDFLVLVEVLGVVWLLRRFEAGAHSGTLWSAAAMMVIACLTKPTAAVLFVAMGGWYLVAWRQGSAAARRILIASVIAGATYAVAFLGMHLATDGQFTLHTVIYQGASGSRHGGFAHGPFANLFRSYSLLLFVPLAALVLRRRITLLQVLCVVSLAWLAFSSMKAGADLNYTLEPIALLVLVAGHTLGRFAPDRLWLPDSWAEPLTRPAGLGALLLAGLVIHGVNAHRTDKPVLYLQPMLTEGRRQTRAKMARFVAETRGLALVEEPYYAVRYGKQFWLSDPFHLKVLAAQGRFDYKPVQAALRSGRIQRALIGPRLAKSPGIWALIVRHYRFLGRGKVLDENTELQMWEWVRP